MAHVFTARADVGKRRDVEAPAPEQTQARPIDTTRGVMRGPCLPPLCVYVDCNLLISRLDVRASL